MEDRNISPEAAYNIACEMFEKNEDIPKHILSIIREHEGYSLRWTSFKRLKMTKKSMTPEEAYNLACKIHKEQWPILKNVLVIIAKSPIYSLEWARFTKKPFPRGEKVIAKSPQQAYFYAKEIKGGRFWEAEEHIKGSEWEEEYYKHFGVRI